MDVRKSNVESKEFRPLHVVVWAARGWWGRAKQRRLDRKVKLHIEIPPARRIR